MTVFGERRKKLLSLARGKQVVATKAENLFYLTDFFGGGAAIALPDKTMVFTSPLEAERAEEVGHEVEVVVTKSWGEVPKALMRQLGRKEAVLDAPGWYEGVHRISVDSEMFLQARRVKDAVEVQRIERASRGLDRIFEELPAHLAVGKTEWEVAAQVMRAATEQGLTPSGSESALSPTIIASGENGALPHSELSGRKLRRGDFVVADIFFRYEGYNSDETRTFAIGSPSKQMRKMYDVVVDSQEAAVRSAGIGVVCGDVHEAAVEVLRKNDVERFLNHSVGHGVGIDIHELPTVSRGSKSKLMVNDVITAEPGVYFPGKYGIRIEDTLLVAKKVTPLTKSTKELVIC